MATKGDRALHDEAVRLIVPRTGKPKIAAAVIVEDAVDRALDVCGVVGHAGVIDASQSEGAVIVDLEWH
jgi:hypothetical protein